MFSVYFGEHFTTRPHATLFSSFPKSSLNYWEYFSSMLTQKKIFCYPIILFLGIWYELIYTECRICSISRSTNYYFLIIHLKYTENSSDMQISKNMQTVSLHDMIILWKQIIHTQRHLQNIWFFLECVLFAK
jgi:hypothetical protein